MLSEQASNSFLPPQPLPADERHLYVSRQLAVSVPEQFAYKSIREAAAAIPDGTMQQPSVIYLEPDVYWTEGTETSVGLVIEKNWLTIWGLGNSPEETVIADARGHMVNAFPADNTANSPAQTMIVNGDGFHAINVTIGNYLNVDLNYPGDSSKCRKKISDVITQAYALGSQNTYDFWRFDCCRIIGMLDTMSFHHRRVYFRSSLIEGTKDFIGGGDCAVYENCEIIVHDTCPMYMAGKTATLYRNCHFQVELEDFDTMYLTKFGGQLILDHCRFDGNVRRLEWELETKPDARCYYRDLTLNGKPVLFSTDSPQNSVPITDEMEASFSSYNLLQGKDGWNPSQAEPTPPLPIHIAVSAPPEIELGQTVYADLMVLPSIDQNMLTIECSGPITWYWEGARLCITGNNREAEASMAQIRISCHGVYGICTILSLPAFTEQPTLTGTPVFSIKDQLITLSYQYSPSIGNDCSNITWYRKSDRCVLAVSRGIPCQSYRLRPSDIGSSIEVEITPNNSRSRGTTVYTFCSRIIQPEDVPDPSILINDFRSFPTLPQPRHTGDFFITAYRPSYKGDEVPHIADWAAGEPAGAWVYGRGRDGAKNCFGIITSSRGASLQYRKGPYTGPISVTVQLCPDKDTGEGFGSANGQYIEMRIKYDTKTGCGYGLRIERVPFFANGCAFSLRRYRNGISSRISETVISSAYMPTCTVRLEARNGCLSLKAETDWYPQPSMAEKKGFPHQVILIAPYEENGFGDVEIHHTGTVPVGNRTLISQLYIQYSS